MLDHMMSSSIPLFTFNHPPRKSFILLTFPPPPPPPKNTKTMRYIYIYNHSPLFFGGGEGWIFIPEKSWPQLGSSNYYPTQQLIDWWINSSTRSTSGTVVVLLFGSEIRLTITWHIWNLINGYKWDKLPFPQLVSLPDFWTINVVF